MSKPYYITTAISYPNGKPHIGHAYEAIAADVIARFQRMSGRKVRFQTGTDEHGLKVYQKARDVGREPRDLADEMTSHFIAMGEKLNISYDRFQRTVDPDHHSASQEIWRRMEANGDLYLDRYEGWYSVRDEAYYDESELGEGEGGEKLSPQGTPVEWTAEESWFFRLSNYADRLLALYADHPSFIAPERSRNEIIRFVEGGLKDLSVSRTSFDWGVKVPDSDGHVMYVWVDALTNYISGLGFPDETEEWRTFWPCDLHLIGKDITRFHAVYWPAFLMSAGIELPKQVFAHGFVLNRGRKESKSEGNVTDPLALADTYGVDPVRYFLMREIAFGQDGSYSDEAIVTRANAELANSFGNFAQRILSMVHKNMDGKLTAGYEVSDEDSKLEKTVANAIGELRTDFEALNFSEGLDAWMRAVFACNQYIDDQAPWALRKTDPERMQAVLMTCFRLVRPLALALRPVTPEAADKLLDQIGMGENRDFSALDEAGWFDALTGSDFTLEKPQGVFPRLELPSGKGEG
ncbi:methionine--tRNA ligase [Pseudoblastomonas halimionae]|uniref:Methionine--tRNA ligase n=1 Tax=Alteriqipengyuania halimionae TaxID=1926630 RepID=A0A6I4U0D1_9SPHN|nr:methionine--tRNA ligase [Alteriqipengyuania halimionae]MXP09489.1 methionine--tRNA ligase [Alteriqipengyuania halimionae]